MTSRHIIIALAIVMVLSGLLYRTAAWAAPGSSPDRQSVPTKTPAPATKEAKDTPVPTATLQAGATVQPQTLPQSGSGPTLTVFGLAAGGLALIAAGWIIWRRLVA